VLNGSWTGSVTISAGAGLNGGTFQSERLNGVTLRGTGTNPFPAAIANTDMLVNGNFNTGLSPWQTWNASVNTTGNRLNIARNTGTTNGGFYQYNPYSAPANGVFQFTFQIGNQSNVARVINMIVRNPDWTDLHSCFITVMPNTPLTNVQMKLKTSVAWSNIVIQGWIQVGDYTSGTLPFRFDNLALVYSPNGTSGATECPQPPTVPPTTPTPTVTPTPSTYKIRFSNELGSNVNWTDTEINIINAAVARVGWAFQLQMNTATPQEAYNRVLVNGDTPDYVYFYRAPGTSTNVTVQYLPGAPQSSLPVPGGVAIGGCATFNSLPRTIICNWSSTNYAAFPEHAIVHEHGHVFTNRSRYGASGDEATRGLLYAAIQSTSSGNCSTSFTDVNFGNYSECRFILDIRGSNGLVMGRDQTGWVRGERGWGSGPDNIFTPFQQHPLELFPGDDSNTRVDETAADMFLNWIYRKTTDTSTSLYTTVPGSWQGFLNMTWSGNSSGSNDANYPGDARYEWMNNVMNRIFERKGW
jgi:hypothetical protein